jgi:hypothetical protein
MGGFVFAETPGMYGAAALHEAMAAETGTAGAGQAAASGAVMPPGLEEVSAANAARIAAFAAHAAGTLAAAAGLHGLYGASVASSGVMMDVGDATVQAAFLPIDAG